MKLYANARTCPNSRRLLVERIEGGWSLMAVAEAAGITHRTRARWMGRFREEGDRGSASAPRLHSRSRTAPRLSGLC